MDYSTLSSPLHQPRNHSNLSPSILGASDGEVTLDDIIRQPLSSRLLGESSGTDKILNCARQAQKDEFEYVWVDTCCIQKTSSAELSEAINSMFTWYKNSAVCYAYLADVPPRRSKTPYNTNALPEDQWLTAFKASRWFKRGWTLQELIAPRNFVFFSNSWTFVGTKTELAKKITDITKITKNVLIDSDTFGQSVACKMSWMFGRETTRIEDLAYCLLGIFNVNMPLLYGEGIYAFHRLQQEIVRVSDDETIFAWRAPSSTAFTWRSLFADHPREFANSGHLIPHRRKASANHETTVNRRLQIQLPLIARDSEEVSWNSRTEYTAILSCHPESDMSRPRQIGIFIKRIFANDFVRVDVDKFVTMFQRTNQDHYQEENKRISVKQRLDYEPWRSCITCFRICGMMIKNKSQNAQLSDVQTENLWNKTSNVINFNENDMRAGKKHSEPHARFQPALGDLPYS